MPLMAVEAAASAPPFGALSAEFDETAVNVACGATKTGKNRKASSVRDMGGGSGGDHGDQVGAIGPDAASDDVETSAAFVQAQGLCSGQVHRG